MKARKLQMRARKNRQVDVGEVLKHRSPVARLLADRQFRQQKVRDRTKYTRKDKHKGRDG